MLRTCFEIYTQSLSNFIDWKEILLTPVQNNSYVSVYVLKSVSEEIQWTAAADWSDLVYSPVLENLIFQLAMQLSRIFSKNAKTCLLLMTGAFAADVPSPSRRRFKSSTCQSDDNGIT